MDRGVGPIRSWDLTVSEVRPGTRLGAPTLEQCQIETPLPVVKALWAMTAGLFSKRPSVVDLGAGDGRFGLFGDYRSYLGVEISEKQQVVGLPRTAKFKQECALEVSGSFDLAIGNPPYIRAQDLDPAWRARAAALIKRETGETVSGIANAYVYFLWLGLLRTKPRGAVAMVVPHDWLLRPSGKTLRDYIKAQGWRVTTKRISARTFPSVKTNASLTLITKAIFHKKSISRSVLAFAPKCEVAFARRGYSPGSRSTFVLTEAERLEHGIAKADVQPCVVTMRAFPVSRVELTKELFERLYVDAGRRCWLLKTRPRSVPVRRWLEKQAVAIRANWTCSNRTRWYDYPAQEPPQILYAYGFRGTRPPIVANTAKAIAVGSVHGIHTKLPQNTIAMMVRALRKLKLEKKVLRTQGLAKVEVRQMNGLLGSLTLPRQRS